MVCGEEEVQHQVSGTVRDAAIYKRYCGSVKDSEAVIAGQGRQVINSLKVLKKKCLAIEEENNCSGMGCVDWPVYQLCHGPSSATAGSPAAPPPSSGLSGPVGRGGRPRLGQRDNFSLVLKAFAPLKVE